MLEFLKIHTPSEISSVIQSFDPLKDTWIVSDLKSKKEIQNEALQKYNFYTDDSILRVSDFWRLWLRRLQPTLSVVGSDFIKSLVQHFVDQKGEGLQITDSEVSTLFKAVQEFAPIVLHPTSHEVIQEWLIDQADKKLNKRWSRWYQLSVKCLDFIVKEHQAIDSKWCAAYLQTCDTDLISWPRKIYLDLGSELSSVEMGLFKTLSQKQDVVVITPDPVWKSKFENLLRVYHDSFGYGRVIDSNNKDMPPLQAGHFVRLSTQLSEVKYAVSTVRAWLDSGVKPDDVAIISSDIERYWPVLQHYLDVEGVDYQKDVVARANGLGDIQTFLAEIKNHTSDVSWDSLEKSNFTKNEIPSLNFEKFKSLFYQLYDEEDLGRDARIYDLYYRKNSFTSDISRDEFLSFLIKIWMNTPQSETKSEIFEFIFKDILSQSLNVKMKIQRWILFLKSRLGSKEFVLKRSSSLGVHVVSLMSAQMIKATHKIYLGLNEELYSKKQLSLIHPLDAQAIQTQFDLAIDSSEESYLDFNLRWQALGVSSNTLFTSAHLSFESDPINASLFFIENSPQSDIETPAATRVDMLQQAYIQLDEVKLDSAVSIQRLKDDVNGVENKIKHSIFKILTVSDLENYAQCSFKLLASKGYRLRDYAQVGIDLDPRDKGNLAHNLFEFIINKMQTQNRITDFEIGIELENIRQKLALFKTQDEFWKVQKTKFIKIGLKFVEFEKERVHFFRSETEKDFKIYFDTKESVFKSTPTESGFQFNLRIDRVDQHKEKKYVVVYDYKSSNYSIETNKKWLDENQFQMLLYLEALRLYQPDPKLVKGALYYFYKNFDISRGLIEKETGLTDFSFSSRNSSLLDSDSIASQNQEFLKLVSNILNRLESGEFKTNPVETKICGECDWRKLCRAPHLN